MPSLMDDWVRDLSGIAQLDPLERLQAVARSHAAFEQIHPFSDGNGRTGRLVMNLILVRLGYPPAIILKGERSKYLQALGRADHGDVAPLGELVARSSTTTLHKFIMPAVAGRHRNVPLAALVDKEVTARALRNAAERGRLRATRGSDGQWRSNANAVAEYKVSRYRRSTTPAKAPKSGWGALAAHIGLAYSPAARMDLEAFLDDMAPRYRRMLQLRYALIWVS